MVTNVNSYMLTTLFAIWQTNGYIDAIADAPCSNDIHSDIPTLAYYKGAAVSWIRYNYNQAMSL